MIAFSHTAATQNCCVRLDDASGYTPTASQLAELEAAACRLIDSLPQEFQDSFKVYDFGFYLHNETFDGGYPEAFQWAIDTVQTLSKYYLLFGKQTDRSGVYTRFWVDLRLPETGIFSCLDENEWNFLKLNLELTVNAYHQQFQSGQYYFQESEIEGINLVKEYIVKQKECCYQVARIDCEMPCLDANKIKQFFEQNGFSSLPVQVVNGSSKPLLQVENISYLRVNDFTGSTIIVNGVEYNLDENANNLLNQDIECLIEKNCRIFLTKNEQFCNENLINDINNDFYNTPFDLFGWVHIWQDKPESSNAIMYLKFKGSKYTNRHY